MQIHCSTVEHRSPGRGAPMTIATAHAILRYIERVDPRATCDQAIARLDTPRIREMILFGAREIILGRGHHAVVADGFIVTVRPKPFAKRKRCAMGDARTGHDVEGSAG